MYVSFYIECRYRKDSILVSFPRHKSSQTGAHDQLATSNTLLQEHSAFHPGTWQLPSRVYISGSMVSNFPKGPSTWRKDRWTWLRAMVCCEEVRFVTSQTGVVKWRGAWTAPVVGRRRIPTKIPTKIPSWPFTFTKRMCVPRSLTSGSFIKDHLPLYVGSQNKDKVLHDWSKGRVFLELRKHCDGAILEQKLSIKDAKSRMRRRFNYY